MTCLGIELSSCVCCWLRYSLRVLKGEVESVVSGQWIYVFLPSLCLRGPPVLNMICE